MKARYWIGIAIAGILIGMSAYHFVTRLGSGDPAPDFVLTDSAGRRHSLSNYRGKVVLLHFWSTWCSLCRMEMPAIEDLSRLYRDRGLAVVAVLVHEGNPEEALKLFRQRTKLSVPVLLDRNDEVAHRYDSYTVPESFFIDRDGIIIRRIGGGVDWDGMPYHSFIERLLTKR